MSEDHPYQQWIDLAQPRLGSRVSYATDEFFAAKERLIKPEPPVFIPDRYDDHGKWMDGWESRRRRQPGHDYCVVELGVAGVIHGLEVDTRHFTGNYPPEVSIDAALATGEGEPEWDELVPRHPIEGDARNFIDVDDPRPFNLLRLHIYPDGGVARLRVYGQAAPQWTAQDHEREIDLAAIASGGRAIGCNDRHYGDPANLIAPGEPANMGDGWETRRRRTPGHDWAIIALGHAGVIRRLEIGTIHFKGNYPDRCSVEAARVDNPEELSDADWGSLLPEQKLGPNAIHTFESELVQHTPVNVLRLNIFPDGGISRLRVIGRLAGEDAD